MPIVVDTLVDSCVFVAPTTIEDQRRKAIEAAIIRRIRDSGGEIRDFLCNEKATRPSTVPFRVSLSPDVSFHGLPAVLEC
jgi:hypothetical protein